MPAGLTSPVHLFVIIFVALIVLGPEKMPQAMRQVGRTIAEVRRWSESLSSEMRDVLSLDAGAEPDAAPTLVAPVPGPVADGTSPASSSPAASAPNREVALPSTSQAGEWSVATSPHPALKEGGEWS